MAAMYETSCERLCTVVNHIQEKGTQSKGMFREGPPEEKQRTYILRGYSKQPGIFNLGKEYL